MITALLDPRIPFIGVLVLYFAPYILLVAMPGWRSILVVSLGILVLCYQIHLSFVDDPHDDYIGAVMNMYLLMALAVGILIKILSLRIARLRERPFVFILLVATGGVGSRCISFVFAYEYQIFSMKECIRSSD